MIRGLLVTRQQLGASECSQCRRGLSRSGQQLQDIVPGLSVLRPWGFFA